MSDEFQHWLDRVGGLAVANPAFFGTLDLNKWEALCLLLLSAGFDNPDDYNPILET